MRAPSLTVGLLTPDADELLTLDAGGLLTRMSEVCEPGAELVGGRVDCADAACTLDITPSSTDIATDSFKFFILPPRD